MTAAAQQLEDVFLCFHFQCQTEETACAVSAQNIDSARSALISWARQAASTFLPRPEVRSNQAWRAGCVSLTAARTEPTGGLLTIGVRSAVFPAVASTGEGPGSDSVTSAQCHQQGNQRPAVLRKSSQCKRSAERDPESATTSSSQGEDQSQVCDQKQVGQSATSASEPQDQSQLSPALFMAPGKLDCAGWVRAVDNLQPALQKLLGRASHNLMATVHSIIARFRTQKQPVPVDLVTLVWCCHSFEGRHSQ